LSKGSNKARRFIRASTKRARRQASVGKKRPVSSISVMLFSYERLIDVQSDDINFKLIKNYKDPIEGKVKFSKIK
jgi:hypothetical protein